MKPVKMITVALYGRTPTRATGLSLIEVLVALLVLSIGLVGLAALHLNSLKSAHSSYYRSIASTVALNLEERLWNEVSLSMLGSDNCLSENVMAGVRQQLQDDWGIGTLVGGGDDDDGTASEPSASSGTYSVGGATAGEAGETWTWTNAQFAGLPNLEVGFGQVSTGSVTRPARGTSGAWIDSWVQIPVTLTWTEGRFAAEDQLERFDYLLRVNCVPEWDPSVQL